MLFELTFRIGIPTVHFQKLLSMIRLSTTLICSIFFLTIINTGCKKKTEETNTIPTITHFVIEKEKNEFLSENIQFVVKGGSILATALNIYRKTLIPTFTTTASSVTVAGELQNSGTSAIDFTSIVTYTVTSSQGSQKNYFVKINWVKGGNLPHIYINTQDNTPITSKKSYVNATIAIDGKGEYADYNGTTQIRGRGNSTWSLPKKPYRLKLTTKAELFGLSAERDWVLLANYLDPTLMLNTVAMKIGQQLEIPYTNNMIPVDVTLNGNYVGSYNFTEQIEVEDNRVNVGKNGLLLELDTNFDEDYKFYSQNYSLPVMLKYPDLDNNDQLTPIAQQFNQLESLIADATFPNNNYKELIDVESVADFLIVQFLTDNQESNHPKSTYINKTATGKYRMGPLWDYDWAYGYESGMVHFQSATLPYFWGQHYRPNTAGTKFFKRFMDDPTFVTVIKQKWTNYKANHFANLISFIDTRAKELELSKASDRVVWGTGDPIFKNDVNRLKNWLAARVAYIDTYLQGL